MIMSTGPDGIALMHYYEDLKLLAYPRLAALRGAAVRGHRSVQAAQRARESLASERPSLDDRVR